MSNSETLVKPVTTCLVPKSDGTRCGRQFIDHPLNVQVLGEPPDARSKHFVQGLYKHIEKSHPEAAMHIFNTWNLFFGFLVLGSFETEDTAIHKTVEDFAAYMRYVCRVRFSDDDLLGIVAHLGFTQEQGKPVLEAFKYLRDILTGQEQLKAVGIEPKPLVTL